jgi:myo-inositol-1(or 4)-monophosphatase
MKVSSKTTAKKSAKRESPSAKFLEPSDLLPVMIEAAEKGGKILKKYWEMQARPRTLKNSSLNIMEKAGHAGLVTKADFESERACVTLLKKAFRDFDFLTEEGTTVKKNREQKVSEVRNRGRWILDPLDGTTNFVHGFPMFCVSLGAELDGVVVAGVIYHPILGDLYTAVKGGGAFLNGSPINVSNTKDLKKSLLSTGFSYRKNQFLGEEMEAFENLSKIARAVRRPGSAALDLAYVARGVFDGFWERRLSPWDVAAGGLLVKEAGGKVTDFSGARFQVDQKSIVATNGLLHRPILSRLK